MSTAGVGSRAVADQPRRRVARWLRKKAPGARDAALHVLGTILGLLFGVPLAAVGAFKAMSEAFQTDVAALEVFTLSGVMAATAGALWWAFTGGRVHEWLLEGRTEAALITLAVVLFASVSFSGLTILLYQAGHVELSGSSDLAHDSRSFDVLSEFYLWHLADTVPLLDIPDTVRWEQPLRYSDSLSGFLLLLYKSFVILPLLQVGRLILAGRDQGEAVGGGYSARR